MNLTEPTPNTPEQELIEHVDRSTCITCRFFDSFDEDKPDEIEGRCVRNAPGVITKTDDKRSVNYYYAVWPIVHRFDRCGEHRPI